MSEAVRVPLRTAIGAVANAIAAIDVLHGLLLLESHTRPRLAAAPWSNRGMQPPLARRNLNGCFCAGTGAGCKPSLISTAPSDFPTHLFHPNLCSVQEHCDEYRR